MCLNSSLHLFGLFLCSHIRECLKLDQDDKDCFSHYKQVKKLSKQLDAAEELIQMERLVLLKDWCSFYTQIMILLAHPKPLLLPEEKQTWLLSSVGKSPIGIYFLLKGPYSSHNYFT